MRFCNAVFLVASVAASEDSDGGAPTKGCFKALKAFFVGPTVEVNLPPAEFGIEVPIEVPAYEVEVDLVKEEENHLQSQVIEEEKKEEEECPICRLEFKAGDKKETCEQDTGNKHPMHEHCLKNWEASKFPGIAKCPVCRVGNLKRERQVTPKLTEAQALLWLNTIKDDADRAEKFISSLQRVNWAALNENNDQLPIDQLPTEVMKKACIAADTLSLKFLYGKDPDQAWYMFELLSDFGTNSVVTRKAFWADVMNQRAEAGNETFALPVPNVIYDDRENSTKEEMDQWRKDYASAANREVLFPWKKHMGREEEEEYCRKSYGHFDQTTKDCKECIDKDPYYFPNYFTGEGSQDWETCMSAKYGF